MTKRFFTVCIAVFVLGAVLTIAGIAAGGAEYLKENGYAISGGEVAAERKVDQMDMEFDSVEASGNIDIEIVGSRYYNDVLADHELKGDIEAEGGKVVIISDEGKEVPTVKTDGKKLVIGAPDEYASRIYCPTVIVFCSEDPLRSINVDSVWCDLDISGVNFDNALINLNDGDVDCKGIISGGIDVTITSGDADISGVLNGLTKAELESGDIEIDAFAGLASYSMDISAPAGDIVIGDEIIEGGSYTQKGGEAELNLKSTAGDIKVYNK